MDKIIQLQPNADGKVVIANDNIILEDKTKVTFNTDNIESFVDFVKGLEEARDNRCESLLVFYNTECLQLRPKVTDRYTRDMAKCTIVDHSILSHLKGHLGRQVNADLEGMESMLTDFRRYVDTAGLDLLSHVMDFEVNKIQSFKRKKDRKGNFAYALTRESGNGDFEPPQTIRFDVPLFKDTKAYLVTIPYDVELKIGDPSGAGECEVSFKLTCPEFADIITDAKIRALRDIMEPIKTDKYWGSISVASQDDSWKYQANSPDFNL